jgi:phosphatidylserine decarboxylase
MKFAKYAKVEPIIFGFSLVGDIVAMIVVTAVLWYRANPSIALVVAGLFVFITIPLHVLLLMFYRDPVRKADRQDMPADRFLAPADGKITDITEMTDDRVGGRAIRIGIFLSVFNVHINRSPCNAVVVSSTHKKGEFLNAMKAESSHRNECNDLVLDPIQDVMRNFPHRIVVRQIAGLLAKRIVADVQLGQTLKIGEKFGMIKLGSRTELILPADSNPKIMIKIGQMVKAGEDVLVVY